jgi:CDP-glucose 4,6-dehydratase
MNSIKNFYKGKRVFITGHTGFKGAWLSYWLYLLGAKVTGYALEPEYDNCLYNRLNLKNIINTNIGDIRDSNALTKIIFDTQPEIVFHLAAQALVRKSYADPVLTFSTNVMGSLNLLESLRHYDSIKALVYITSDKCYWNSEWVWGYRESDALGGPDPYSASKACAEHIFKSYHLSYFKGRKNFGCGSVRAGNVIGGGDYSKDRIIPDVIRSIENNQPITLRHPKATRPWQHVLDPLHGYLLLGKYLYENPNKYNGEAWNFGPLNHSIKTVLELTEKLIEGLDGVKIKIDDNQNTLHESTLLHLSIDKAQTLLKWSPIYNFDEAVKATGNWYTAIRNNKSPTEITTNQIQTFMEHSSNSLALKV